MTSDRTWGNVMAWLFAIGDYITFETEGNAYQTHGNLNQAMCGANERLLCISISTPFHI